MRIDPDKLGYRLKRNAHCFGGWFYRLPGEDINLGHPCLRAPTSRCLENCSFPFRAKQLLLPLNSTLETPLACRVPLESRHNIEPHLVAY
jgi:hypothetical protein